MNKNQPYKILWWTIPIILVLILFKAESTFDLQSYDTYFVITSIHVAILFTLFLGILGGVYWFLRFNRLNSMLSKVHFIGTSLSLIGFTFISILQTTYATRDFELFRQWNKMVAFLILIFIGLQIIFLTNLMMGLIRRKKT